MANFGRLAGMFTKASIGAVIASFAFGKPFEVLGNQSFGDWVSKKLGDTEFGHDVSGLLDRDWQRIAGIYDRARGLWTKDANTTLSPIAATSSTKPAETAASTQTSQPAATQAAQTPTATSTPAKPTEQASANPPASAATKANPPPEAYTPPPDIPVPQPAQANNGGAGSQGMPAQPAQVTANNPPQYVQRPRPQITPYYGNGWRGWGVYAPPHVRHGLLFDWRVDHNGWRPILSSSPAPAGAGVNYAPAPSYVSGNQNTGPIITPPASQQSPSQEGQMAPGAQFQTQASGNTVQPVQQERLAPPPGIQESPAGKVEHAPSATRAPANVTADDLNRTMLGIIADTTPDFNPTVRNKTYMSLRMTPHDHVVPQEVEATVRFATRGLEQLQTDPRRTPETSVSADIKPAAKPGPAATHNNKQAPTSRAAGALNNRT